MSKKIRLNQNKSVLLYHAGSPPVGMSVLVISAMPKIGPMRETFIGVIPFFAAEITRVAILVEYPTLTLWLPNTLSG
ncbi:MAG: hypothetical protein GY742_15695 [Hyphomicrobiales bacterium]|nr:hypothetical protein [Hyphomicrobiales bacterium]